MSSSHARVRRKEGDPYRPPRCPPPQTDARLRKNLKGLVRDNLETCVALSAPRNALEDDIPRRTPLGEANFCSDGRDVPPWPRPSAAAATRRRQSRLLDRWAARQAREMVTTIERRAHEAELQALCDSHPVSNRSASFLRETSPTRSDVSGDLPNLRASSLVQMWRELEAEAATPRYNRTNSMNSTTGNLTNNVNTDYWSSMEEPSAGSFCDSADDRTDWESEPPTPTEPPYSSRVSSEIGESERGRVADMIRKLTAGNATQSDLSYGSDENDLADLSPSPVPPPISLRDPSLFYGSRGRPGGLNAHMARGRQVMKNLLIQIVKERKKELARLRERQAVSGFSHRGRIQSLIRFRFLGREVAIQNHWYSDASSSELNHLQNGASIMLLRGRCNYRIQRTSRNLICERSVSLSDSPYTSETSGNILSVTGENDQYPEITAEGARDDEPSVYSQPSTSQEPQEEASSTSNMDWIDRSLSTHWVENNSNTQSWEGDEEMEEVEADRPMVVAMDDASHQRQDEDISQCNTLMQTCDDWNENSSGNQELQELLERRRVSTALASDFRERMDQMLLSHLQRLENEPIEEDDEGLFQQGSYLMNEADLVVHSSQLPLPSEYLRYEDHVQEQPSFAQQESSNSLEIQLINELRGDIMRLHHEMSDLRKSVQDCMDMHMELRYSVKREGPGAMIHSGETTQSSSGQTRRKGNCCICYEMPVDSLLYRCGHMCTCFKCAHELQWSSGRCPICRATIMDVVRAYSDP